MGEDSQVLQQKGQDIGEGCHINAVALPENEISSRGNRLSVPQHGADQYLALHDAVQIVQGHVAELALLVNPQLHNLHTTLGKGIPLQETRIFQKPLNLRGRLSLRVHRHGQAEHLAHDVNLVRVLRIAHPGYGVDIRVQAVGRHAAQQIHLVRPRHGDQQIRLLHPGLNQHIHGSAVPVHYHDVIALFAGFQYIQIGIYQCQVIPLRSQLAGQSCPHLAVAGNDYLHGLKTSFLLVLYLKTSRTPGQGTGSRHSAKQPPLHGPDDTQIATGGLSSPSCSMYLSFFPSSACQRPPSLERGYLSSPQFTILRTARIDRYPAWLTLMPPAG